MRKSKIMAAVMALAMTVSIYSPVQAAGYCINGNGNCPQIVIGGNGNSCNATADIIQKYITGNGSCGTKCDEQTKTANDKTCQPSTEGDNVCRSATKSSNTCQTIIRYGNLCQPVQENNDVCTPVSRDNTTEQFSTQRTTEQPNTQVATEISNTEQSTTQATTEKSVNKVTTEQLTTEKEKTTEVATPIEAKEEESVSSMSEDQASAAGQVLNIVNQNRSSSGLHSLRLDADLCVVAQIRANEIVRSFSHTRPDGRKFSTVLTDNGIRFTAAGENIAWGQKSPEEVMSAWMNSDGHRANIMNTYYTKLGVGHVTVGGRQYWVQLFSY